MSSQPHTTLAKGLVSLCCLKAPHTALSAASDRFVVCVFIQHSALRSDNRALHATTQQRSARGARHNTHTTAQRTPPRTITGGRLKRSLNSAHRCVRARARCVERGEGPLARSANEMKLLRSALSSSSLLLSPSLSSSLLLSPPPLSFHFLFPLDPLVMIELRD